MSRTIFTSSFGTGSVGNVLVVTDSAVTSSVGIVLVVPGSMGSISVLMAQLTLVQLTWNRQTPISLNVTQTTPKPMDAETNLRSGEAQASPPT